MRWSDPKGDRRISVQFLIRSRGEGTDEMREALRSDVSHLRRFADALLIASPEYAHGVSGVIKNALDWMVGNESLVEKPVGLLNAAPRASIAQAALRETLLTMSARVVAAACVTLPILGSGLDEEGIVRHQELAPLLVAALSALRSGCGR